ncbi:MAG: hypothetical protein WCL34_10035 [Methylococcaceae bacterium]
MSKKQIAAIGFTVFLIVTYIGVEMYVSNIAEEKVNNAIAKAANFADINYKKVSVDLLGMDVRISDITISPTDSKKKLKIDEIVIRDIDDKANVPTFLSVSFNGIELNMAELGEKEELLRKLDYSDKMMVNLNLDYVYNEEKTEIDIKKIGMGADEVGEITASFRLGNISLKPEEIAGLLFNFPQLIFHEAKIEYKDDSLVERLMRLGSEGKKVSVEDFKRSLIQYVEEEVIEEKDDFMKKMLSEFKDFLDSPRKISISASPSKPQPFGRIMNTTPKDVVELLNIQVKSENQCQICDLYQSISIKKHPEIKNESSSILETKKNYTTANI